MCAPPLDLRWGQTHVQRLLDPGCDPEQLSLLPSVRAQLNCRRQPVRAEARRKADRGVTGQRPWALPRGLAGGLLAERRGDRRGGRTDQDVNLAEPGGDPLPGETLDLDRVEVLDATDAEPVLDELARAALVQLYALGEPLALVPPRHLAGLHRTMG